MVSPKFLQKTLRGQKGTHEEVYGEYIVETGDMDKIFKYKEIGAFSEWPFLNMLKRDMNERDKDFLKWLVQKMKENSII